MSAKITPSQQLVLNFLRQRIQEGVPPSVREICAATGIKSTSTVHGHLCALEEAGYISRASGLNRSIKLSEDSTMIQVPLLGRVTAGAPVYATEDIVAHVPFPTSHYRGNKLFALRVKGDSMHDAGILDGDIIIVEKCPTASNGEIVVALIDEEATVKRLYQEESVVRLQPENDCYQPIYVAPESLSILGRVVSCIRYYG
ncbi:MAG: transcriptional repressor LexA [Ruminococcaceae bacterium]|nr:transcriptional repressor LexA [Oscillospiraceae bacterium]